MSTSATQGGLNKLRVFTRNAVRCVATRCGIPCERTFRLRLHFSDKQLQLTLLLKPTFFNARVKSHSYIVSAFDNYKRLKSWLHVKIKLF